MATTPGVGPRPAQSLRLLAFGFLAAAWIGLGGALVFGAANILVLPLIAVLTVVVVVLGVRALLVAGEGTLIVVVALAICLIDLGLKGMQFAALGIKGVAYLLCFVAGVQFMVRRAGELVLGDGWLLAYAVLAWATVGYSIDRWTTTQTGFALMALALVTLRLGATLPADAVDRLLRAVGHGFGVMLSLSLLLYVALPQLAVATEVAGSGRMAGLYGSPNSAGGVAGIAWLIHLSLLLRPGRLGRGQCALALLFALVAAAALVLTGSRNAAASTAIATVVLVAMRWRMAALVSAMALALAALAVTVLGSWGELADQLVSAVARTRSGLDVRRLTGRTEIWAFVWGEWLRSPTFGYGLGGVRTLISEGWANFWGKTTGTAHNALLESLVDLGWVGTTLLLGFIGHAARNLWLARRTGSEGAGPRQLAWSLLVFVLLFGVAEKSFAGTPSTSTGALLLVAIIGTVQLRVWRRRPTARTSAVPQATAPVAPPSGVGRTGPAVGLAGGG